MSEIEQQNVTSTRINRRTVVKGAAWSVPVIAAAIAAPAASASTASTDLAVAFGGSRVINLTLLGTVGVNVTLANTLTISNIGSSPSTGGEKVTVTFPSALSQLTLVSSSGLATITTGGTTRTITLPIIPAGSSEVINMGLVSLPVGILTGNVTINATLVAADTNPSNNTASSTVGITVL